MPRTHRSSLPWMVAVVVGVAIATLAGVSSANPEPGSFLRIQETTFKSDDSITRLALASSDRPESLTTAFANVKIVPAPLRLAELDPSRPHAPGATLESDDSFRIGVHAGTDGFVLTTAGLFNDLTAEAFQLAALDSASDVAQRTDVSLQVGKDEIEEYDPWQPFNEGTFAFNRQLDRFLVKPVATVWDKILPDPVQRSLSNAFENLGMPRRFVNKLFQLRLDAAGLELTRFLVNSTVGIAGFFDVAKALGIEKKEADTGQTLGVYGAGPGPYLILPFLPPFTVRDGIGTVFDLALDPLNYILPFAALAGMRGGNIVNERSLTLELFQNVEETVVDLYSAVRNGYLQRRQMIIRDAIKEQLFR